MMSKCQELKVLKFDCYPNAIAWLDENPGVAVNGESRFILENASPLMQSNANYLHIMFSSLMDEADKLMILEWFPEAIDVKFVHQSLGLPPSERPHLMYLLHDWDRNQVVEVLKKLGATVKKSACCHEEVEIGEIYSRLSEMEIRLGKRLSQASPEEFGDLYRKLYPH